MISIYDKFVEDAVAAFEKVKVGLPWEKDTIMGLTGSTKRR